MNRIGIMRVRRYKINRKYNSKNNYFHNMRKYFALSGRDLGSLLRCRICEAFARLKEGSALFCKCDVGSGTLSNIVSGMLAVILAKYFCGDSFMW